MRIKIALIGDGKTGGKVLEIIQADSSRYDPPTVFNINHRPTLEKLKNHDVIISFIPGPAFLEMIPMLLESRIPVVTGSTGLSWPSDFSERPKKIPVRWIHANNFSLGMSLVHQMIKILHGTPNLFEDFSCQIHEIHHVHKKDAPSGTALAWKKWLDLPCEITSERTGEVIGTHTLTLAGPHEKITLTHESTDRKIFAQGALWAAQQILTNKNIPYGLNFFENITQSLL
jgi:4-hydroxy-tetrahydrodipicolinate reductase